MQSATIISANIPSIEKALIHHVDKFSVEEFTRIANVVRNLACRDEDFFQEFLTTAIPYVKNWFSKNEIQNVDTLIQIVGAYSETSIAETLTTDFVEMMQ